MINAKHALNFKQHSASSDKNDKLLSADWFDQNKDYLLIETDKDAPAIVSFSDILAVMPDLAGKSSGSLHLLHKGTKYPIYIDDNDGKISADDRLIFLGKRAHGDTTWYDFYTKDEPFYLYYDALLFALLLRALNTSKLILILSVSKVLEFFIVASKQATGISW